MALITMNYDKYKESLKNTPSPINSNDPISSIKIDIKGLLAYAKSVGKTVPELSDEEKEPFVDGGMEKLKATRGFE